MKSGSIFFVLIVMTSVARDCPADNGELAIARPLNQITVDGDLSDWPASLPWYAIERAEHGVAPQDADDFDARFRLGYDQQSLYVAVEVRDESTVIDGTMTWHTQDGCSVYLDLDHQAAETRPIQYNFYGDHWPHSESASAEVVTSICRRSGTIHHYEWRFDVERISPQVVLKPGRVIGLDISVCDMDEDTSFSWLAWGRNATKNLTSRRIGDILLASSTANSKACCQWVSIASP
ncbi:MAG: sugar-binding protein [Fuerstiella sp.]